MDDYTIYDSLENIEADSLATAMARYGDDSSPYSFLSQYSYEPAQSTSRYSAKKSIEPSQGSSSFGFSGSSGGLSRGYADFPTIPMPTLGEIDTPTLTAPEMPVYTAPERDEARRSELQTKAAAPGLTRLRRGLDRGIQSTRSIDNPTERKFQLSGMLEEYGLNLGDIISKADMTGLQEYETEFATQLDQAKTRYGAEVQGALNTSNVANQNLMLQYQQDLADRNAKYALESQVFAKQGIQKQAEALTGGSGSGGLMIAGKPYITGNNSPQWRGYNI